MPKLPSPWKVVEAFQEAEETRRPDLGLGSGSDAQTRHEAQPQRWPSTISEKSRICLLPHLFCQPKGASETERLCLYVEELGLNSNNRALAWKVQKESSRRLQLPPRQPHSGNFEWIGRANEALPAYLWDSERVQTIEATPDILRTEGYIAVSWSWGRFQEREGRTTRQSSGTSWRVPIINEGGGKHDLVHDLKACLKNIKTHRYFWVDVLCINQKDELEKKREIAKQATIFGNAAGVISYLWTLESADALIHPLRGLELLLSWALTFSECPGRKSCLNHERGREFAAGDTPFSHHFERLRIDYWFTSLWALQEIVLAPAAVWMARNGEVCRLNGRILTTRLFSMTIRLLSWAEKQRTECWKRARDDFRQENDMSIPEFDRFLSKHQSHENAISEQLTQEADIRFRTYQKHLTEPKRSTAVRSRSVSPFASLYSSWSRPYIHSHSGDQGIVVQVPTLQRDPPWIIKRYDDEEILRSEIRKWTTWAFGTACIDVSLSASRAAILVAGKNRAIVKGNSREEALLAALKVQPHSSFLASPSTPLNEQKHLSPYLINVLLQVEGPKLFNVAHGFLRRDNRDTQHFAHHGFEETEWMLAECDIEYLAMVDPPESSQSSDSSFVTINERSGRPRKKTEYQQRGNKKFVDLLTGHKTLLTDMLPDTASQMNPQVLHFTSHDDYEWADGRDWHIHRAGALHIPQGQLVQRLAKNTNDFVMFFRPTGCEEDLYNIKSKSDLKLILSTQPWLQSLLKSSYGGFNNLPQFLFLPLGIRRSSPTYRSWQIIQNDSPSNKPAVIGVVLVSKCTSKNDSMTTWYKFGMYAGYCDAKDRLLDWDDKKAFQYLEQKDGILVTAFEDANQPGLKPITRADCSVLQSGTEAYFDKLRRRSTVDLGWQRIGVDDILQD
ncbi:hypothetical protein FKW77_009438 [Venturia effusa]|uniref:Heterokaryon incompatibility domain-containing protein n=1 Tax=Venturia effusa TaxID=50376 RepID=A0A517L846_9PEZI|nr:hypothetical protein FKW77_009438 [Venturia effusa]